MNTSLRALVCCFLIGLLWSGSGWAQHQLGHPQTLVLGVAALRDQARLEERFQPLVAYLNEQLEDQALQLKVLSPSEIWQALQRHELDFVVTDPVNFIALSEHNAMSSPLVTLVMQEAGEAVEAQGGVMLQAADQEPFTDLKELKEATLAIAGRNFLGGYLAQARSLQEAGLDVSELNWLDVGPSYEAVVEAVLAGRADVGFIRTGVMERLVDEGWVEAERLRVVNAQDMPGFPYQVSTRLYPQWPLVTLPQVRDEVARKVASVLLALDAENPVVQQAGLAGFNVPSDYSVIERDMRRLQIPPFNTPQQVSWVEIWYSYQWQILILTAFVVLVVVLLVFSLVLNRRLALSREHLEKIAHYDLLTGLPNYHLLSRRLQEATQVAWETGRSLAVCYMDLDNFKQLNDHYGHGLGDELLLSLAQRLQQEIDASETLARVSGDEFALVLTDLHPSESDGRIKQLMQSLHQPLVLSKTTTEVSASLGITLFPLDRSDPDTLLRHASEAMFRAKSLGKNRYYYFDADLDREQQGLRDRLQRLQEALEAEEFLLYYQPKVDLRTQEVLGVEALIRWQHPEEGLLPPGAFLPDIEASELENPLGNWVISQALSQLNAWHEAGLQIRVSVNISASHLLTTGFATQLEVLLAEYPDLDPGYLEIEVLETAALGSLDEGRQILEACHRLGVKISLDDFGTGYSSLAYFRNLPVDILKIDQSFVRDMLEDREDRSIVESVVRLAAAFNRQVIAEGVETLEHAEALLELGCFQAQGYGIARPLPAEEILDWTRNWEEEPSFTS
ncbi:EAL domain-containing protein [Marinospirillum perlucidum]|uniref:EAL domain-containing protein n=1 Tax=Marinospirillum perlucidum TaxID=1982602 RepID=UPI000DF2837C|nr:EAL domain-containing protein [Marinospirillum perlucidum]